MRNYKFTINMNSQINTQTKKKNNPDPRGKVRIFFGALFRKEKGCLLTDCQQNYLKKKGEHEGLADLLSIL